MSVFGPQSKAKEQIEACILFCAGARLESRSLRALKTIRWQSQSTVPVLKLCNMLLTAQKETAKFAKYARPAKTIQKARPTKKIPGNKNHCCHFWQAFLPLSLSTRNFIGGVPSCCVCVSVCVVCCQF